VTLCPWLQTL